MRVEGEVTFIPGDGKPNVPLGPGVLEVAVCSSTTFQDPRQRIALEIAEHLMKGKGEERHVRGHPGPALGLPGPDSQASSRPGIEESTSQWAWTMNGLRRNWSRRRVPDPGRPQAAG
jgi:hypothetical protein